MKVQIEIEIPDGHELVSHRLSSVCDNISHGLEERSYHVYSRPAKPLTINGVTSDWPEWLTCDWVAADDHGRVHGYNDVKPFLAQQCYACGRGTVHHGSLFGIDIKIPGPWEQSLRENPRRKK